MSEKKGSPVEAFEALRAEVAATHAELSKLAEGVGKPAPDYSPTLGAIANRLDAIEDGLGYVTGLMPPIELPEERETPEELRKLVKEAKDAALELRKVIKLHAARWWMAGTLGFGMILGIGLWIGIATLMPSSAGTWMASAIFGGDPWDAGQTLMRQADPVSFQRMVELYQACPQEDSVDLCRAAMAVKAATAAGQ
jgi:hypothetical protein